MNLFDNVYAKYRRVTGLFGRNIDRIGAFETNSFTDADRDGSDLHRIFYGNHGPIVHKWKHYLSIYDRHLSRYRGSAVRMLEIGVFKGGSLRMWREYLGSSATIFGIDIDPGCKTFDGLHAQVRIGSQDDAGFLDKVLTEMGGVDVIVDDGSHLSSHQIKSFQHLFPKLSDGGIYICEDLHSNYWRGWHQGGYRRGGTFIETTKRIIDDMHSDFHQKGERELDRASRSVGAMHFYNSMIVIEKSEQQRPAHIKIGTP